MSLKKKVKNKIMLSKVNLRLKSKNKNNSKKRLLKYNIKMAKFCLLISGRRGVGLVKHRCNIIKILLKNMENSGRMI